MHHYRKKTIKFLMGFLVVFLIVFFIGVISYINRIEILDIGIGYKAIDIIIIVLCALNIAFIIKEIIKVETKSQYEKRIKASKK